MLSVTSAQLCSRCVVAFCCNKLSSHQHQLRVRSASGTVFRLIGYMTCNCVTLVAPQSINMFFAGADTELLDKALSPQLATWHYFFVVVMTPLILLNLLIALMGGS